MTQEMKAMIELVNQSSKEVEPMSKADKMFVDLGYKDINMSETAISYQDDENSWESKEIIFYYNKKSYMVVRNSDDYYIRELCLPVSVELHTAINEKMKDLGWLNEQSI